MTDKGDKMENQMKEIIEQVSKDSYSVYLREIALLMEENDSLKETIKNLEQEIRMLCR
tara:strand:+ start:267 stop:440 length:174 start_codon:yes stop_codon:yes gene_type:complete